MIQQSKGKGSFLELLALKMPPSNCVLCMEAVCIVFAKKPGVDNFKKLSANYDQLVDAILKYDYESTSDYVRNCLKKYVDDERFAVDSIKFTNSVCASLCMWTRTVHDVACIQSSWALAQETKSLDTLKNYMMNHAYRMHSWPAYVFALRQQKPKQYDQLLLEINALIDYLDLKSRKIWHMSDYYDAFTNCSDKMRSFLSEYNCFSLPEQHAKAESARVSISITFLFVCLFVC